MTAALWAYRHLAGLLGPVIARRERAKLARQGLDAPRQRERLGHPSCQRPAGELVWLHGASVGESQSLLPLVVRLSDRAPETRVLMTCGTASAARLLDARLPSDVIHQFLPVDSPVYTARFLDHWRPDLAILAESEIWPSMLQALRQRRTPVALVNARLSERSIAAWMRMPATAVELFGQFRLATAQTDAIAEAIIALGTPRDRVRVGPELKSLAPPLPVEDGLLAQVETWRASRPLWLAASTHPGEDQVMLDAHALVRRTRPDALLVIVPRHPERGDDIARLAAERGFVTDQRSRRSGGDQSPASATQVHVADTLGELGLWYRIAEMAFIGASLIARGGHNPFEAANLECAILHGPNLANFADAYARLDTAGAAIMIRDEVTLADAVIRLLDDAEALRAMRDTALSLRATDTAGLDDLVGDLLALARSP